MFLKIEGCRTYAVHVCVDSFMILSICCACFCKKIRQVVTKKKCVQIDTVSPICGLRK